MRRWGGGAMVLAGSRCDVLVGKRHDGMTGRTQTLKKMPSGGRNASGSVDIDGNEHLTRGCEIYRLALAG